MSTEMGVPSGGFDGGYTTQNQMDKMLEHLKKLAKEHGGAGIAYMYIMYAIMPHSLDFQEGQLNHEVRMQQDLTQIMDKMKNMQELFNSCENQSQDYCNVVAGAIKNDWTDILNIANRSDFGPLQGQNHLTGLADQLYSNTGSLFQSYFTIKRVDSDRTIEWNNNRGNFGKDIHKAWEGATTKPTYDNSDDNTTTYDGDNGAAVKRFQDLFDNIDTTASGQQGSVQSEMKYYEQVYQSMEATQKNVGQAITAAQKSAVTGMKPS